MYKNAKWPEFLVKPASLVIYALFFLAQLSFNTDLPHQFGTTFLLSDIYSHVQSDAASSSLTKTAPVKHSQCNFRLNKRFQPERIEFISAVPQVPFYYPEDKQFFHYSSDYAPSAFTLAPSLRGPPAIA
jgi:hypothetical protein